MSAFSASAGSGALGWKRLHRSFYDLRADCFKGTSAKALVEPPDDWSAYAISDWAQKIAAGERYDPEVEHVVDVQRIIDAIYCSDR